MTDEEVQYTNELNVSQSPHGRTAWDALTVLIQSKGFIVFGISIVLIIALWLLSDYITLIPVYAVSSVFLSLFWYNPISIWLSRQSQYIEVWEPNSNTFTTYRVGKDAFASLQRDGYVNVVQSITGNNRIFASGFDPHARTLELAWVHDCDPWTFHLERRTLNRLTERVNEVLDDLTIGEAMAQVEGRIHARSSMQRHYSDLDSIFFGDVKESEPIQPEVVESHDV